MTVHISNADRARYYTEAVEMLRRRQIHGRLEDGQGGVCVVGAINRATGERADGPVSRELQREVLAHMFDVKISTRFLPQAVKRSLYQAYCDEVGPDRGLVAIEHWNDSIRSIPGSQVKLLAKLAQDYTALAKDDRIAELEVLVRELQEKRTMLENDIAKLQARVAELEEEVGFWKAAWRRGQVRTTAKEMRRLSSHMEDLDNHLDNVARTLEAELTV